MSLEQETLEAMPRQHPAWRLLLADSAPLIASFLHRVFVAPNVRTMGQAAATAMVHRLTVVTRNVGDFAHFDVKVLNPFETP